MKHSKEFEKLLQKYSKLNYIKPGALPNIDLYMDQVTTFMDSHLASSKRHPEDKILTKTMINNYTKNNLLPTSDKKKYSQEHILLLIFIYYLKNILSISDIQTLLKPLTEQYFGPSSDITLQEIYEDIIHLEIRMFRPFYKDILGKVNLAEQAFPDAPEEDRDYLENFSMICMLAFDVYLKKQMIETIIDDMKEEEVKKAALSEKRKDKPIKKADAASKQTEK